MTICNMLSSGDLSSLLSSIPNDMQAALQVLCSCYKEVVGTKLALSGFLATAIHNLTCTQEGRRMIIRGEAGGEHVVTAMVWLAQQQAPVTTAGSGVQLRNMMRRAASAAAAKKSSSPSQNKKKKKSLNKKKKGRNAREEMESTEATEDPTAGKTSQSS